MNSYVPTDTVYASGKSNIGALFHNRVVAHPQQTAAIDGHKIQTYNQLEDRSNRMAQFMIKLGLEQGDRMVLLAPWLVPILVPLILQETLVPSG